MEKHILEFFKSYQEADEQTDFQMASDLPMRPKVISTGSIALDNALNCGGAPAARISQFYSGPGVGKSLLAKILCKNAQIKDPEAYQLWIDAEQTFNPSWAEELGLNTDKIILVDGDLAQDGKKCFEFLLGTPKEDQKHFYVGKKKEGFFDQIINGKIKCNLIVFDSIGACIPPLEMTSEVGKAVMTPLPRFLSKEFKKIALEVKKANVPFIVINHKRTNLDPYASSNHLSAGGNSYHHYLSVNIYFEAVGRKDTQLLNDKEQKIGHTIKATVEKCKFGPWPRQCEFKIDFSKGIVNKEEELINVAIDLDIITKPSSMSYEFEGEKWVGMPKLTEAVQNSEELQNKLRSAIEAVWDKRYEKKNKAVEQNQEEQPAKRGRKKKEEE